jgi:hypothetical protein
VVANQVAFCCGTGAGRDAATAAVLAGIHREGAVYPTHGLWRGGQIIRASVIGHAMAEDDIDALVEAVRRAWARVQAAPEAA